MFNVFTNSARVLIREHLAQDRSEPPAVHRPRENEVAHYVVVGFGKMGQAFALEAARLAHFENTKRLRITILDDKIGAKRNRFITRYPRFCPQALRLDDFDSAADDWAGKRYRPAAPCQVGDEEAVEYACNAEFLQMAADFPADRLADDLRQRLAPASVQPSILVCFDDDGRNFEVATLLQAKLSDRRVNAPVYVWLPVQASPAQLRSTASHSPSTPGNAASSSLKNVIPFGVCEQSCTAEESIRPGLEELARAVHEYYRERFPHPTKASSKPWDELAASYRTANFLVAEHLEIKLLAIGRRRVPEAQAPPDQPRDAIAAHEERLIGHMEHNRWLAQQLLEGWSYGPERHEERKQDPDICAWKYLPPERRELDFAQVRHIPEILKKTPIRECIVPA